MRGIGNKRVISTSKTKKRIARIKNCKENGVRDDFNGLNPHSNGKFIW